VKLYTKTGDDGTTGLFGGERVPKNHPRVAAYGEVDELNAAIGVVIAMAGTGAGDAAGVTVGTCVGGADESLTVRLAEIQGDLFVLGAELATPNGKGNGKVPTIQARHVERIEGWIDDAVDPVPPLRTFILPGGTLVAAQLHSARTVCRRAERAVVSLADETEIDANVVIYLNRLGDLLFALARWVNHRGGVAETPWIAPNP